MKCAICGVEFKLGYGDSPKQRKYCTRECYKSFFESQTLAFGHSGDVGSVGELWVSIDLMKKGYQVFRAISPASSCDLIASRNGVLKRVEVTKGQRRPNGKITFVKHNRSNYDLLAIFFHDGSIEYTGDL